MTDHLFISSPTSVLRGDAARVMLETTNDAAYLTEGKGVLSVPLERWQKAQAYERETWLVHGINSTEDRNTEHAGMFNHYDALPVKLGSVIELGCGAFTNLRHILPGREAKAVILVDPLAEAYRTQHPNCAYKDGTLCGFEVQVADKPIEYPQTWFTKLDTVVMVNVLSHCYDIPTVFERINTMLKKGGYLVFGEPARDINVHTLWDAGHPLSYNQGVIDDFLSGYKEKYRNGNYFIGVKK